MKHSDLKIQSLLKKYLAGNCNQEETIEVEIWYSTLDKEQLTAIGNIEKRDIEERIWANLKENLKDKDQNNLHPSVLKRFVWFSAAASITLLISLGIYFYGIKINTQRIASGKNVMIEKIDTDFSNLTASIRIIILPDGSKVSLQPRSRIKYLNNFTKNTREVSLEGEAFFNVVKNPKKPFIVFARNISTTVLGTSFTIKAFSSQDNITVSVKTGKVIVSELEDGKQKSISKTLILTPNQQAVFLTSEKVFKKELVEKPIALLNQKMAFEEKPVNEVFEAFNNYYGIKIKYNVELLKKCTITASFYNETFYEKLEMLCKILGATYEINGTEIQIKSDGCNNPKL